MKYETCCCSHYMAQLYSGAINKVSHKTMGTGVALGLFWGSRTRPNLLWTLFLPMYWEVRGPQGLLNSSIQHYHRHEPQSPNSPSASLGIPMDCGVLCSSTTPEWVCSQCRKSYTVPLAFLIQCD